MPGEPLVSICVPCYNVAKWLPAMIKSVEAQTYTNWQLCTWDDGSTDETRTLARFRGEHEGFNRAFNHAVSVATGSIICRLDADDEMDPTRLEKQVRAMESADICTCEMLRMDEDGKNRVNKPVGPMDVERYLSCARPHPPIDASIMAWRRVYEQVGLYNPAFPWAADDDWVIRALQFGFTWVHVPEFLYHYRTHPGQMTRQCAVNSEATYRWLCEKAREWNKHPASR
jgi:glycosyltransferase involved in cell wall biosynthesis